jgi:adenylate cyclase
LSLSSFSAGLGVELASQIERRLAAIVFADLAGFSRHLSQHELETLRRWKAIRLEIMEPYAAQNRGRVVEMAGDALLLEFPSAVNALRWAMDVQRAVASRYDESDPPALNLRIGINVEDVIVDGGVLQGDGVNIAARIHQAAKPGQIVVTGTVREYVSARLPVTFHDLGTPPLKNIARPVRVFAVEWADTGAGHAADQPYLQWSTRPTVAVLPFRNIGENGENSYFGEGITEDIITGLSRSRSLYVIARTSTLRYRERDKDLRQIAVCENKRLEFHSRRDPAASAADAG